MNTLKPIEAEVKKFDPVEFIEEDDKGRFAILIGIVRNGEMMIMDLIKNTLQMSGLIPYLGQSYVELEPTSIHFNNKVANLSKIFKESGISIYDSFVGDSITNDLSDKCTTSMHKLREYHKTLIDVSEQRHNRIRKSLIPEMFFGQKIWRKYLSRILRVQPVNYSLTEEERSKIDRALGEYNKIDDDISNYQLEDNIVKSLVKQIAIPKTYEDIINHQTFVIRDRYKADEVPGLMKEKVIPELKKLGLEHLIPELQEALIEKYKEKLHNLDIIKPEAMYKYVPDFSQISEESDQPNLETEKESTKLGIESYEQIDSEVRPSQRNAVINAIKQEQEPEKSSPGKIIEEGTEVEENT